MKGDFGPAVDATANKISDVQWAPAQENLYFVDQNNKKIRVVLSEMGPHAGTSISCLNGIKCWFDITGNGLTSGDSIARVGSEQYIKKKTME